MILGNGFMTLSALPLTYAGSASGVTYPGNVRTMFGKGNRTNRVTSFGQLSGSPQGVTHPTAFILPNKAGRMSVYCYGITITPTGVGVLGAPVVGTLSISTSVSNAVIFPLDSTPPARTASAIMSVVIGDAIVFPLDDSDPARTASASAIISISPALVQLISSGSGTCYVTITSNNPLLTASIGGTGTSYITVSPNNPLLGAIAQGIASSSVTLTPTATILPLNDTPPVRNASAALSISPSATAFPTNDASPLRNANATISVNGNLVPHALGEMIGSTDVVTTLTANNIWDYGIEGEYTAKDILKIVSAVLAGKVEGAEGTTVTFRDLSDTLNRITAQVDSSGNRSSVTISKE